MSIARPDYTGPTCPLCDAYLDVPSLQSGSITCPTCERSFEGIVFRPQRRTTFVRRLAEDPSGAPCAYHAGNAAISACGRCGTFICGLCRIDADEMVLCPSCYDRLTTEGTLETSRTHFRDYGAVARTSAAAGCLIWFLSVVFGIGAIYYGIKALRQKRERGETEGRRGAVLIIIIGAIEIIAGLGLIAFFIYSLTRTPEAP